MYNDGFKLITNMDYSSIVIDSMRDRCKLFDEMLWLTMDINDLKFENNTFDCVIEKGKNRYFKPKNIIVPSIIFLFVLKVLLIHF